MPMMRRRPLLRAAAVGGSAYLAGKHVARQRADQQSQDAAQEQRISNLEQQQATVPPPRAADTQPGSMTDQINQLADLHGRGVLSDDEYTAAKAKLLGI